MLDTAHLEKHLVKEVLSTKVENGMEPFITLLIAQIKMGFSRQGNRLKLKLLEKKKKCQVPMRKLKF